MNYKNIYDKLIYSRKQLNRKRQDGYFERHHITPRCLNGTNDKDNLILLTAKEHFIAHLLLVRIFPENKKLKYALWCMCTLNKRNKTISSKLYATIREEHAIMVSKNLKGRIFSDAWKAKLSIAQKNATWVRKGNEQPRTKEQRELVSKQWKGVKKTEAQKIKIGLGHKNKIVSEETKKKISESKKGKPGGTKGRIKSEEEIAKFIKTRKERNNFVAWNKGLTKETDIRVKKYAESKIKLIY